MEETGIDLLGLYARVGVRDPAAVVEVVEHRKSVAGLEGIDQILRGLQEVVPAREEHGRTVEDVAPVRTPVDRSVGCLGRVLHGKDRFAAVGVFRQEVVREVGFQTVLRGAFHVVGVGDHVAQRLLVYRSGELMVLVLREGPVEPYFGQIGCRCGFADPGLVCRIHVEGVVGCLEILGDPVPELLFGQVAVAHLLLGLLGMGHLVDVGHVAEDGLQLEVEVRPQEAHLGQTGRFLRIGRLIGVLHRDDGLVHAGDHAVETVPHAVDVARRGEQRGADLHVVVSLVVGFVHAALVGVVRADVAVGPVVERAVPVVVAQRRVGGDAHLLGVRHGVVAVDDARQFYVQEVFARAACAEHRACDGQTCYESFHFSAF